MEEGTNNFKYIKIVPFILVATFFIYSLTRYITVSQGTGFLVINSPGSTITITKLNYDQKTFNSKIKKIRLKPGVYTIIASNNKAQQTKSVTIYKKITTSVSLNPTVPKNQSIENDNIAAANKLVQILPFTGPNFEWQITYSYSFSTGQAIPGIIITATSQDNINNALIWLKSIGYNPVNLNLSYKIVSTIE